MRFQSAILLLCTALALGGPVAWAQPAQPAPTENPSVLQWISSQGLLKNLDDVKDSMGRAASGLVMTAMGFLGVPYKRGGESVESGFDCSGLVRNVYEQSLGLVLPRRAKDQAQSTRTIAKEELKPGDLVFFNTMRSAFSHVGIYIGDGKFVHAPRTGAKVRVEDMREAYWTKRFNGARRVDGAQRLESEIGNLIAPAAAAETPSLRD
jgi:cell wall-associated NlpC family hydrolase